MKYFTKEWYDLMQQLHYTLCMRPIADKDYTDAEIEALYKRKLAASIRHDRKEYNAPPQPVEIDFDNCSLDDFVWFDGEKLVYPKSMDEVKQNYEEEYRRAKKEFELRPPFDESGTVKMFERMYEGGLEHGYSNFPDWVKDKADVRLIALGYLPKSVYDRLKAEQKRNRAEFNKINRAAEKTLRKQAKEIPERISRHFGFHDGSVISFQNIDDDVVMIIKVDGIAIENETPYARITFVGGEVIERDGHLKFARRKVDYDGEQHDAYCTWLYEGLYKTEDGYEAHMLLTEGELGYLTIRCKDIQIEFNVHYDEQ
ncbi:MAG: DUF4085 domain-containing protein [Clostridiales bacterium]|nr:DUF4085 domain-containing protein [Clostridiales bacterium]